MSLQLYDSRWTVSYQAHSTFQSSMFEKPLDNCSWVPVRMVFIYANLIIISRNFQQCLF